MNKELIVLDLFCGAGGFSLGFEQAGFTVKHAIDNNKLVQETFEYNHPNTEFNCADIKTLDPRDYKNCKVVIGGPPCVNFSVANNNPNPKKGMELVLEFFRFIEELKPKYWLMENVRGVMKHLKLLNFPIPRMQLFNCADYGVPQKRIRCFSGKYPIPPKTHAKVPQPDVFGNMCHQWRTVWDAISDIILIEPNQDVKIRDYQLRENFLSKHEPLELNKPSRLVTTKDDFAILNNHDCYNFNQEKNNPKHLGKFQGLKILNLNEPSYTITDNHGNTNLIPNHECFDNII